MDLKSLSLGDALMPFPIKFALSIVVLAVAAAAFIFEWKAGMAGPSYAILFLAPFMIIAMWIFPEVTRRK